MSSVGRILVIDDDHFFREVARHMLLSAGHEVLEATDGKAGVACYRQGGEHRPSYHGYSGARTGWTRNHPSTAPGEPSEVKIIATSGAGQGRSGYLNLAVKLGARRFLVKPFTRDELLTVVSEVLAT